MNIKDLLLIFRYVDYTGDIQTATILLVVGRCFMKEPSWPVAYSAEDVASIDFELQTVENEMCKELLVLFSCFNKAKFAKMRFESVC